MSAIYFCTPDLEVQNFDTLNTAKCFILLLLQNVAECHKTGDTVVVLQFIVLKL